ncbi:MAG: DUF4347 domain-containing protein, partial [Pseudomonadota bacterium]
MRRHSKKSLLKIRGNSNRRNTKPSIGLIALEQRFMFDAAGVATGTEALADAVAEQQTADGYGRPNFAAEAMESDLSKALQDVAEADHKSLVFVDTSVEDHESIVEGIGDNAKVVLLDPTSDGVNQIASALEGRNELSTIHIISHGGPGELQLGTAFLTFDSMLGKHVEALTTIRDAMSAEGDILIYGCNFAEGETGERALNRLAELTQTDVAGSDDATGSEALGGDWELEVAHGTVESNIITVADFSGVLDLEITAAADSATAANYFTDELVGSGITVSNLSQIGSADQVGLYSNDDEALGRSILEQDDGVVFVTGDVTSAASPAGNTSGGISTTSAANVGDTDLEALSGNTIFDASGYDFNFTSTTDRIGFFFSFASDEYPEYVGTVFNDAFGFFISGGEFAATTNLATIDNVGIAVNTINSGIAGSAQTTGNAASFVTTNADLFLSNTADPYLEYDGLTKSLFIAADVTRGTLYDLKLAIGDAGDAQWDSAVFFRTDGFTALVSATDDQYATSNSATISGNVITDNTGNNVDVAPVVTDTLSITQVDGAALTGNPIVLSSGATLTIGTDGSYQYDPSTSSTFAALATGATATDTFTYTVTDGKTTDTATVIINITGAPQLDLDQDDSVEVGFDFSSALTRGGADVNVADIDVSALSNGTVESVNIQVSNIAEPNSESLTFLNDNGTRETIVLNASMTTASVTASGVTLSVSYDGAGGLTITDGSGGTLTSALVQSVISAIQYGHNDGSGTTGDRTFAFALTDSLGYISNTAVATISVVADVTAPTVANDSDTYSGAPIDISVLANDADDVMLDPASVLLTNSSGGVLSPDAKTLTIAGEGTWTVLGTGAVRFTPQSGFTGTPSVVSYTVADVEGNRSSEATITLSDSTAPLAENDTAAFAGSAVTVAVDANDGNGEPLNLSSVQIVGTPNPGDSLVVAGEGTWSVNTTNGDITFTPAGGFTGVPTPIQYTIDDTSGNKSNTATVTLADTAAPVAQDDASTFNGVAVTVPVDANDGNGEALDLTSVQIVGTGAAGDSLVVAGQGTWSVNTTNGDITFTPVAGFTGVPTPIQYTINDSAGNTSNTATVTLTDAAAPVAQNDAGTFDGTAVTVAVDTNDGNGEALDPASVQIVGTSNAGDSLVVAGQGTWSVNTSTGDITFTPIAGFTDAPTAIQYSISDVAGNVSNTATVTLTDGAAPTAQNDTGTFGGVAVTVPVDANDGSGEALDLSSVQIVGTSNAGDSLVVAGQGTWSVNTTNGDITFTPVAGFTGVPTPIQYTVDDTAGNTSNTATVTLTDAATPVAQNDAGTFTGAAVTIEVDTNDGNGEALDPASVQIVGTSNAGDSLVIAGQGTWSVNTSTGDITFTPIAGFTDAPTAIQYSISDVAGNVSNTATV